jgi:hypothetical protein
MAYSWLLDSCGWNHKAGWCKPPAFKCKQGRLLAPFSQARSGQVFDSRIDKLDLYRKFVLGRDEASSVEDGCVV